MPDTPRTIIANELNDDGLARLSEIHAMRQVSETLSRMGSLMQNQTEKLEMLGDRIATMHTDIEVMKVRDERTAEVLIKVAALEETVRMLEMRNAQQDGAAKFLDFMQKFGPWLLAILAFLWGLFGRKAG